MRCPASMMATSAVTPKTRSSSESLRGQKVNGINSIYYIIYIFGVIAILLIVTQYQYRYQYQYQCQLALLVSGIHNFRVVQMSRCFVFFVEPLLQELLQNKIRLKKDLQYFICMQVSVMFFFFSVFIMVNLMTCLQVQLHSFSDWFCLLVHHQSVFQHQHPPDAIGPDSVSH